MAFSSGPKFVSFTTACNYKGLLYAYNLLPPSISNSKSLLKTLNVIDFTVGLTLSSSGSEISIFRVYF